MKSKIKITPTELTVEKLRTYPGFENFTDEKAIEAIKNTRALARVLFSRYQKDVKEGKDKL